MDNPRQQLSDTFWETYFPDLIGKSITEHEALDANFWEHYQTALESADAETTYAIVFSKPAVQVTTGDMYSKIVRTAKRVWDKKTDPIYQKKAE